jgi:hypothetical protein
MVWETGTGVYSGMPQENSNTPRQNQTSLSEFRKTKRKRTTNIVGQKVVPLKPYFVSYAILMGLNPDFMPQSGLVGIWSVD